MTRVFALVLIGCAGVLGLLSCPSVQFQIRCIVEDYRMRRRIARTWNEVVRDKEKYGHLRIIKGGRHD